MPSQDARVVEIARLKNRLLELESQLKEEKKVASRLKDISEKKSEQVNVVDAEIAAEVERFRWKKEEMLFHLRYMDEQTKAKVKGFKAEEKQILIEIAEFDLLQHQNEKLHARLKLASLEHKAATSESAMEREQRKQKNFDTRMAMEDIMRKAIKSVDESYEAEATAKMQFEASQARIENEQIKTEFDRREAKTEALIRQQQQSYDQLMHYKIERDVMTVSTTIQDKSIQKLIHNNNLGEKELATLRRRVQRIKDQVEAMQASLAGKSIIENNIKAVEQETHLAQKESAGLRAKSVRLCHKILKECQVIVEKSRARQNERITQQLNELSGSRIANNANEVNIARQSSTDIILPSMLSTSTVELEEERTSPSTSQQSSRAADWDSLWKVKELSNTRQILGRSPEKGSFSMMFR